MNEKMQYDARAGTQPGLVASSCGGELQCALDVAEQVQRTQRGKTGGGPGPTWSEEDAASAEARIASRDGAVWGEGVVLHARAATGQPNEEQSHKAHACRNTQLFGHPSRGDPGDAKQHRRRSLHDISHAHCTCPQPFNGASRDKLRQPCRPGPSMASSEASGRSGLGHARV